MPQVEQRCYHFSLWWRQWVHRVSSWCGLLLLLLRAGSKWKYFFELTAPRDLNPRVHNSPNNRMAGWYARPSSQCSRTRMGMGYSRARMRIPIFFSDARKKPSFHRAMASGRRSRFRAISTRTSRRNEIDRAFCTWEQPLWLESPQVPLRRAVVYEGVLLYDSWVTERKEIGYVSGGNEIIKRWESDHP